MIIEKNLDNWGEFKTLVDNSRLEWIYRGQSNSEWKLSTSLERSEMVSPIESVDSLEIILIEEYRRAAKYYIDSSEIPDDLIEWMALIQHHGTPTRLIDFTESPYIAAYFAFEKINAESEFVSIWIINRIAFYQKALDYLTERGVQYQDFKSTLSTSEYSYSNELLKLVLENGDLEFIFPLEPFRKNTRYRLQQSVFIAPSNSQKPLLQQTDFLDSQNSKAIIKINLPSGLRNEALRDLFRMNITRASLFPGLDGFAQTLNTRYSTLTNVSEMTRHLEYLRANGLL